MILIFLAVLLADVLCIQEGTDPSTVTANIGESVAFLCRIEDGASPVWIINETYYNINRLPADYSVQLNMENYTLIVNQAKLWMNNTVFACYFVDTRKATLMGKLYVTFDFIGPADVKVDSGDSITIPCNSSLISQKQLSVVWKINDVYYNPTRLPTIYMPTANGLYISETTKTLDGYKFQCLFKSDVLWKNNYFKSSTAILTIVEKKASHLDKKQVRMTLDRFKYKHQSFSFSDDSVTIAWTNASCIHAYTYGLVKEYDDTVNITGINSLNQLTLSRHELVVNNSLDNYDVYDIYIQANSSNSQTCGVSEAFIVIPPQVQTIATFVLPGHDKCFNDTGLRVVWPESPSGGEDCICDIIDDLSGCSCIHDTIYRVELVNKSICWRNMTKRMNKTKILFFEEYYAGSLAANGVRPFVKRKYLQSHEIIIAETPGPPEIYAHGINEYGNFYIFIQDSYTGHSPISKYNLNITDITGYFTMFSHQRMGNNEYITVPDDLMTIMSTVCAPQYLVVSSENSLGHSSPSTLQILPQNTTYDRCQCIFRTVEVKLERVNTSSTSITVQVNCKTMYNFSNDIHFTLEITQLDSEAKVGRCNEVISFGNLKADSIYLIHKQWSHCSYDELDGPFQTLKAENNTKLTIIIVAAVAGVIGGFVVLVMIVVIILCRCCISKLKQKRNQTLNDDH